MTGRDLNHVKLVSAVRPPERVRATAVRSADRTMVVFSKLRPPPPRRRAVVRQELLGRLAVDSRVKLVLVVAPAGWGKTSLLGEWCSARGAGCIAWFSVDRGDNDPVRFWAHFLTAMYEACPEIDSDAVRSLAVPGAGMADILLPRVINDFALTSARITVIVDDYHLISNPAIHECVEFFIEHLPPTVRLVLATRSDPALPLARLRARGEMAEIRADELRFSEEETAGLLNETMNLGLRPEHVRVLRQRTEGWAAGLYLAGLSLRGHEDRGQEVRAFAGDNRQIADYLAAEVLAVQPADIRSFLIRTAVLGRMCGGLCDAVTGERGSQRMLEQIERSDLFVVPLDSSRCWYRYHTLFADVLRRELNRSQPGLAPLLHRRAWQWHRQHGSTAEAVCHAIMASDLSDARELIAARSGGRFDACRDEIVESWLNSLPPDVVSEDSRLCLIRAWLASNPGERSQPLELNRRRRGHRSDGLTDREVEVFELLAAGKTNNEIAADLVVSVHTVERHLQNAYRKVGVRNRGQAAAYITRAAR